MLSKARAIFVTLGNESADDYTKKMWRCPLLTRPKDELTEDEVPPTPPENAFFAKNSTALSS